MGYRGRGRFTHLVVAASICAGAAQAVAQAGAQQARPPRWELYGGYSAFNTGEAVFGLLPGGITPVSGCLCWNPRGAGTTLTYDIRPWMGVTADFSGHWGNHPTSIADQLTHADFYNISAGPKFTYTSHHFAPFAEFLAGGHRLAPELFQHDDRFGIMAGGGIDLEAGRHFSVRLVRADYVYSNHHFGPEATVPTTKVRGIRLQAGIVYRFGGAPAVLPPPPLPAPPPPPPPVIEVIEPPTVTCAANPSVVNAGDPSTITANGVSPQGRPLVYSYQATAGSISGAASTTTLYTAGAAAGPITVTCQAADDKGHTASASTSVTVVVPVGPVKPPTSKLCSIRFERDLRRPDRVDNEAKACLDEVTLSLQRNPDARLAVIGNAGAEQQGGKLLASKRAVNTKAYLVGDKGVDPSRITAYVGDAETKTVDNILIPPGASLDEPGISPVDEGAIKPVRRSTRSHGRK